MSTSRKGHFKAFKKQSNTPHFAIKLLVGSFNFFYFEKKSGALKFLAWNYIFKSLVKIF